MRKNDPNMNPRFLVAKELNQGLLLPGNNQQQQDKCEGKVCNQPISKQNYSDSNVSKPFDFDQKWKSQPSSMVLLSRNAG